MRGGMRVDQASPERRKFKAWHALAWFLGFFGFMFAVNGIFVWTAITTFPGEDIDRSYLAGVDYNRELARRAQQAENGWRAEIGLTGDAPSRQVRVRFVAADGDDLPVFFMHLELRHPTDRNRDRELMLLPVGGGEFAADLQTVPAGAWTAHLGADVDPSADGLEFSAIRALRVP